MLTNIEKNKLGGLVEILVPNKKGKISLLFWKIKEITGIPFKNF
jgi:hypothetical protein